MKKILFVEDDALVARIYSQKLAEAGFEVAVAEDGLAAMRRLPEFEPDVMVLDLMMPKLTGADVLKFVRQHPQLKSTHVVVLSNSFLSDLVEQVTALGVDEALIKASVTPAHLVEVIKRILAGPGHTEGATGSPIPLSAKPQKSESATKNEAEPAANAGVQVAKPPPPGRIQREFLEHTTGIFRGVRQLCLEFFEATEPAVQVRRSEDLRRKIGFLTQMTSIAGYHRMAVLCSAVEALMYELKDRPSAITDSSRHTISTTVAFLADCLNNAKLSEEQEIVSPRALAVDDDAVSNRTLTLALGRANISTHSVTDPFQALKRLEDTHYDLVFLDIVMPGLDGLALCEKMRVLPLHKRTPVIFLTNLNDFKTRYRSVLSGGNDLMTKPIMPTEVCVKAITQLLKANRLAAVSK